MNKFLSLIMNLDTYDLPTEEFKHMFQEECDLLCALLKQHQVTLEAFQIPIVCLKDPRFFWSSFIEVLYATSEDARIKQKKENPKAIEKRRYDSIYKNLES